MALNRTRLLLKIVKNYINKGQNYEHVSKVYSVNIVYLALGKAPTTSITARQSSAASTTGAF